MSLVGHMVYDDICIIDPCGGPLESKMHQVSELTVTDHGHGHPLRGVTTKKYPLL